MRTAFPHVHSLIGENYSFHASICYLLLLKEFRGHHGNLYPKSTDFLPSFNLTKRWYFPKMNPKENVMLTWRMRIMRMRNNNEKNEGEVLGGDVLLKEIPKKCCPNRSKVAACRELLNQMKGFTFVVYESLSANLKDFSHHEPWKIT